MTPNTTIRGVLSAAIFAISTASSPHLKRHKASLSEQKPASFWSIRMMDGLSETSTTFSRSIK